jgi:hypothetical protein
MKNTPKSPIAPGSLKMLRPQSKKRPDGTFAVTYRFLLLAASASHPSPAVHPTPGNRA